MMCVCSYATVVLSAGKLDVVKQGLTDIQVREAGKQRLHHPKLHSVVSVVNTWKTTIRKHTREKVGINIHTEGLV